MLPNNNMNSITLTLLTALFCISCYGQKVLISPDVSASLPKNTKILTADGVQKLAPDPHSVIKRIKNTGNIYELGGLLIYMNSGKATVAKDHLNVLSEGQKELIKLTSPSFYHSDMKSYPTFDALVVCYEIAGQQQGQFSFHCINKKNSEILVGLIEYPIRERTKAKRLLEEILSTLEMK